MQVCCPACRAEWMVADQSLVVASCPKCGQLVSSGAEAPLPEVAVGDTPSATETGEWPQEYLFLANDIKNLPVRMGRYFIQSLIAQGGFSKVYLAIDEELGRKVALKIPRPEKFANAAKLQQFLVEARLAAKLRHSGIVTIFDVGHLQQGLNYIAMEYVAGEPLSTLVAGERLPFHVAAELLAKIADAVHEAHLQGLVHRDIKPSNILIDERGEPRVVDFGLAVHEDSQSTMRGEFAGTPAYMSPEQYRGEAHRLDGRTDIWSLGAVLYQLLTGRRPFNGDLNQLRDEVLSREPKPLRQIDDRIPRELEAICLKCLAKPIENRYTTARDLAEDLRRWQSTQPRDINPISTIREPNLTPVVHVPRIATRSKRWIAVALALVGIGSFGFLAATVPTRSRDIDRPVAGAVSHPDKVLLVDLDNLNAPVDERAKPLVWLPLLIRKPKMLIWDGDPANDHCDYSMDRQELFVDALDIMMAELGQSNAEEFKLQVTICKNSWTGSAGLFWGYTPNSSDGSPEEGHRCQSLYAEFIHKGSLPVLKLCRDQMVFSKPHSSSTRPSVRSEQIAEIIMPSIERAERLLEIRLKRGWLTSVRWMGEEIDAFRDTEKTVLKAPPATSGEFGIINHLGTSRFRDARFQLVTSE